MKGQQVTKTEFREYVEHNLWPWLSSLEKDLSGWLLSVEEWTQKEYWAEVAKRERQD